MRRIRAVKAFLLSMCMLGLSGCGKENAEGVNKQKAVEKTADFVESNKAKKTVTISPIPTKITEKVQDKSDTRKNDTSKDETATIAEINNGNENQDAVTDYCYNENTMDDSGVNNSVSDEHVLTPEEELEWEKTYPNEEYAVSGREYTEGDYSVYEYIYE